MNYQDIIVIIVYILLLSLLMFCYKMYKYKKKDLERANHEIELLKKNLDDALHCPNTVSFNSYECSPITLSTTITVADWSFNYAINNKDFVEKRDFIIRQAIHEMAEEFTKIPEYIYIDYTQDDIITDNMKVTIKLKILPCKEEM